MHKELFNKVIDDTLAMEIPKLEKSDDFAAVFVEGRPKFLNNREDLAALTSFKVFSEHDYPIYLFLHKDFCEGVYDQDTLDRLRVKIIPIEPIHEEEYVEAYSKFYIYKLFYLIEEKHENILTLHPDGFLIKSGWEKLCKKYGYLAPHWQHNAGIDTGGRFDLPTVSIGNGGFSFRKASIIRKINTLLRGCPIYEAGASKENFPPEDLYFAYFTYGFGLSATPSFEECDQFCSYPLTKETYHAKLSYGFHKVEKVNPWI